WHRLDFQGRYWADYNHWQKQETYQARFRDYFEYEAHLVQTGVALDPPRALGLPVYYENGMVRLLPVLEYALGRMIEAEDRALLRAVLDRMGILYRLHQVPLTTLMNTLFVFFDAPTLHDAAVVRSLNLALLDISQQSFTPEFVRFVRGGFDDASAIGAAYVCRVMERIARAITRHLGRPEKDGLPEIHYREIPNPILLALTETVVELLTWWCLHCAPASEARLRGPPPAAEADFCAEEQQRRQRAAAWPVGRLWVELAMEPERRVGRAACSGAAYLHSTGVLANVLPDELLTLPIVEQLADIVLSQPALRTVTGPRRHFSFAAFSRLPTAAAATRHAAAAAAAAPSSV
ncbi:hypothetical protein IWQ57_006776, partial [Coemansia nantahalensis]